MTHRITYVTGDITRNTKERLGAVLGRYEVLVCWFVSGPWHFDVSVCIHLWGQVVQ